MRAECVPSPNARTIACIARPFRRLLESGRNEKSGANWGLGSAAGLMNILYMNIRGVIGENGRAIQTRGHHLVLRSGCIEAFRALRDSTFDAVVIEDDGNDPEILRFTVETHQSHPALPIFVANTFGHGLLRAIEQFGRAGKNDGGDESELGATCQPDSTSRAKIWDDDSSFIVFSSQDNIC